MIAASRSLAEEHRTRRGTPCRTERGITVDRCLEPPPGRTERSTFTTWFARRRAVELSGEHVRARRSERLHAHVDRGALPRARSMPRSAMSVGADRTVRLAVRELPHESRAPPSRRRRRASVEGLNPKYTFDLFVIGSSNRFAHAAALAVAEAPAQAYNPLFIYGGTGLGKTHLLQAIAHYVGEHSGDLSARYVTSETFMNDFINSLRDKRIEGFKQRYRHYDVLLDRRHPVPRAQGADPGGVLPHVQHALRGRPADRPLVRPAAARHRDARGAAPLALRVGPDHDIQPPDLETRIAILRKKVKTDGDPRPRPQVLTFIAEPHLDQHPRARGRAHTRRRVLLAHRPAR